MHLKMFKTAILLSELKSFRAVAERMNITQAAVSSRILTLEQELGVKLFLRDPRGVTPTKQGLAFIDGGRNILADYEKLARSVIGGSEPSGIVKIGFVASMATTLLPLIARSLKQRFKQIQFTIHIDIAENLERLLANHELDIALVAVDKRFETYDQTPLCGFGSRWVASPDFLSEYTEDGSIEDDTLGQLPLISYEMGTTGHNHMLHELSKDELEGTSIHYSNSLPTSISMAIAGLGIASVSPVVIQRELKEGTLKVIGTNRHLPMVRFLAITIPNSPNPIAPTVVSLARDMAALFCEDFEDSIATAL